LLKTPRHLMQKHECRAAEKLELARTRDLEKVIELENFRLYQEAIFFARLSGQLVTLGDIPNPRAHVPSPQ
jgi:hypothetical protein